VGAFAVLIIIGVLAQLAHTARGPS
jgi:hypothetical protein